MATWSVLCKSLLKGAGIGAHAAKSGIKFAVAHPKTSVVGLGIALPIVGYKKGLLNFAKEKHLAKEVKIKELLSLLPPYFSEAIKMLMVMKNP